MNDTVLDVSTAAALINQTLDYAYPTVTIVGEISSFKISKGYLVYADIKDDMSSLALFGTVSQITTPIEDGMMVELVAKPRLHHKFGFKLNIVSIKPVGKGSIKKSKDLLREKLEKEGLFAPERKRYIDPVPTSVGLITSVDSAAYADFTKILNERWIEVDVYAYDVSVQGDKSAESIVSALKYFSESVSPPDVAVVIRGGGSEDDLASFSDERVVRAVSASRVPTAVAIGHEVDVALAELAADMRASTPSNAAELLFPDKKDEQKTLEFKLQHLENLIKSSVDEPLAELKDSMIRLEDYAENFLVQKQNELEMASSMLNNFHPKNALSRGYALVSSGSKIVTSASNLKKGSELELLMSDGQIITEVKEVKQDG